MCDELAFYRSSEGFPTDTEMLRAVRPMLATTGGKLIVASVANRKPVGREERVLGELGAFDHVRL